jgi:HSP20 family protein
MKLGALSLAAVLAVTATSDAYMYSSGPGNCRPPSSSFRNSDAFSSSPRSNRFRQRQQQRVDQAFRDLQNEMNDARRRQQRRRGNNPTTSGQFDFMMMDPFSVNFQEVDKEAVKKWVDKAFDLASEFNQVFSKSPQEREQYDEFLQKSREWVENMYQTTHESMDEAQEPISDYGTPATLEDKNEVRADTAAAENTVASQDQAQPSSQAPEEPEMITPYSENRSDDKMFQVAVDLPGVEREDVDLTLEKDFLVVQAERRPSVEEASQVTRTYLKKFAVLEDEIEVEKIAASLANGVLTVTAPKKKPEEKEETKIKIPLA